MGSYSLFLFGQVLVYLDDILDSLLQALSDPSDDVIISSRDLI